jgi:uncharacterized protein YndB with AHSA1/START domain
MSHEAKLERVLPGTPEEVFDAYVTPEAQKQWFTILDPGLIVHNEVDLRVGGSWVSEWGFSPEAMFRETQVFEIIERPHRLVTASRGSDPEGNVIDTRVEITFRAVPGGTLMSIHQTGFRTAEERDFFADTAWVGFFDRIEAYLARRAS